MPYSIFFNEGYAIHGSYEISHLGRPASHGCIRLHPQNAAVLFALVKDHMEDTRIVVTGDVPASRVRAHNEDSQRAPRRSDASFESVFGSTSDSNLPATSWRDLR
jgi:hypothetical protein